MGLPKRWDASHQGGNHACACSGCQPPGHRKLAILVGPPPLEHLVRGQLYGAVGYDLQHLQCKAGSEATHAAGLKQMLAATDSEN